MFLSKKELSGAEHRLEPHELTSSRFFLRSQYPFLRTSLQGQAGPWHGGAMLRYRKSKQVHALGALWSADELLRVYGLWGL